MFSAGVYKRQNEKIEKFSKTWIFSKTWNGHFLSLGVFCIKRFVKFYKKVPYNGLKENLQKNANQNTPKSWSTFHTFLYQKHK